MLKRSIALFLLIVMVGGLLIACTESEENTVITEDEAVQIALEDLDVATEDIASIHVHAGTYEQASCYNVYINTKSASKTYVISKQGGKILAVQNGSGHSH